MMALARIGVKAVVWRVVVCEEWWAGSDAVATVGRGFRGNARVFTVLDGWGQERCNLAKGCGGARRTEAGVGNCCQGRGEAGVRAEWAGKDLVLRKVGRSGRLLLGRERVKMGGWRLEGGSVRAR